MAYAMGLKSTSVVGVDTMRTNSAALPGTDRLMCACWAVVSCRRDSNILRSASTMSAVACSRAFASAVATATAVGGHSGKKLDTILDTAANGEVLYIISGQSRSTTG